MKKILLIQTAFLGDVVLATALVEKLHAHVPEAAIDFLLRKGNEGILEGHPFIHEVLKWDKKNRKYRSLFHLFTTIRARHYDLVVNLQRYFSTGFLTAFSGATTTTGFHKNPLSFLFSHRLPHVIGTPERPVHEVERCLSLISWCTDERFVKPRIYPPESLIKPHFDQEKYITIAPASVWMTKQWPLEKWISLINRIGERTGVLLLGGKEDLPLCEKIQSLSQHSAVQNLAGKLSLLESAALMKGAMMNFVNDSAPLHLASAVNAPVTAIFCSTVPAFGFTPLSENSTVIETQLQLPCRPCGLHGKHACPEAHFKCSEIDVQRLLAIIP